MPAKKTSQASTPKAKQSNKGGKMCKLLITAGLVLSDAVGKFGLYLFDRGFVFGKSLLGYSAAYQDLESRIKTEVGTMEVILRERYKAAELESIIITINPGILGGKDRISVRGDGCLLTREQIIASLRDAANAFQQGN